MRSDGKYFIRGAEVGRFLRTFYVSNDLAETQVKIESKPILSVPQKVERSECSVTNGVKYNGTSRMEFVSYRLPKSDSSGFTDIRHVYVNMRIDFSSPEGMLISASPATTVYISMQKPR